MVKLLQSNAAVKKLTDSVNFNAYHQPINKEAALLILKSPNGETDWKPVLPEDVPEILKGQECILAMVNGEMCQLPGESDWYRAEKMPVH